MCSCYYTYYDEAIDILNEVALTNKGTSEEYLSAMAPEVRANPPHRLEPSKTLEARDPPRGVQFSAVIKALRAV